MPNTRFRTWAEAQGLDANERDELILAAARRGFDVSNMDERDWKELAKELGILVGALQRLWGWVRRIWA